VRYSFFLYLCEKPEHMDIRNVDSKRLLFDIHADNLEELVKAKIPEFGLYDGKIPILKVIQYIILMYDVHSPIKKEIKDYIQRKRVCAEMTSMPRQKGQWATETDDIFFGKNEQFNMMVIGYLRELAMPEWTQLVAYHQLQENLTRQIFNHNADKNVHTALQAVTDGIISLTKKVFASGEYDEVMAMRKALYTQIREDIKILRPENIAIELRDKGNVPEDWSAYAGGQGIEKREKAERKKKGKHPKEDYYTEDGKIDMRKQVMKFLNDRGESKN